MTQFILPSRSCRTLRAASGMAARQPQPVAVPGARRRRVLITGPLLDDPGGVANYYRFMLPALRDERQFDVDYLEIGSSRRSGGRLHPVADQLRIGRALANGGFDLVHVNPSLNPKSFLRDGLILRQARSQGIPVLVFFRGWDEASERRVDRHWQWLFRHLYGDATAFIVLASDVGQKLRQWGITAPIVQATTAVPPAVAALFSDAAKRSELLPADDIRILFLARIEAEKGIFETLAGVGQLIRKGCRVTLTVAGDGAAMPDVVSAINRDPELKDRVVLAGYVRDAEKARLLASHHIYCLPCKGEGMPNSLLEAMASGMAVLTCGVGGIKDFFEDGAMGHLLARTSASEVAEKLQKLVNQPARILEMGSYNARYAREHFSLAKARKRLLSAYQVALGARN